MIELERTVYWTVVISLVIGLFFGSLGTTSAQSDRVLVTQSGDAEVYMENDESIKKTDTGTVYILQNREFEYRIFVSQEIAFSADGLSACSSVGSGATTGTCGENFEDTNVIAISDSFNSAGEQTVTIDIREDPSGELVDEITFSVEVLDRYADLDGDGVNNIEEVRRGTDYTVENADNNDDTNDVESNTPSSTENSDSGTGTQTDSDIQSQSETDDTRNRGFLTNGNDSSPEFLNNPLNITTIGLILSIIGILLELRRGV